MTKYGRPFLYLWLTIVLIGIVIALAFATTSDAALRQTVENRQIWITTNKKQINEIFANVFNDREQCAKNNSSKTCTKKARQTIDSKYNRVLSVSSVINCPKYEKQFGESCKFWSQKRLPIYFIRLESPLIIEKLYQSGHLKHETVDTLGELKVVLMLKGLENPFPYPLYTCCGGDDLPAYIPLLERSYLNDFPSEAELIFPIKNTQGRIIGGLVWLYGD